MHKVPRLVVLATLLFLLIPQTASTQDESAETYKQVKLFGDVFERVRADYVEEVSDQELIEAAIRGMLASLDPHSSYLDPKSFQDMRVQTKGEFGGLGIEVTVADDEGDALDVAEGIDAAFGYLSPDFVRRATRLRWVACPQAGPSPSFYHQALVDSNATVTNVRGIFSDHISAHIMSFVLAFSRGLHVYLAAQRERRWIPAVPTITTVGDHQVIKRPLFRACARKTNTNHCNSAQI